MLVVVAMVVALVFEDVIVPVLAVIVMLHVVLDIRVLVFVFVIVRWAQHCQARYNTSVHYYIFPERAINLRTLNLTHAPV